MTQQVDCSQNTDPLKLVREGASQEQRFAPALDPNNVPINERKAEHWMVFAQAYSKYLKYYNSDHSVEGDWAPFFSKDVSVLLAIAAVQDVAYYKRRVKEVFDFFNNKEYTEDDSKAHLGYLFSYAGTLASRLDALKESLPSDASLPEVVSFKGTLQNLIKSQLAPAFERLLGYYKADDLNLIADTALDEQILGGRALVFSTLYNNQFSNDWITNNSADWRSYRETIQAIPSIFGSGSVRDRIHHIATHNLFSAIFDQFLKAYARIVSDAQKALNATYKWDGHEPHYALFLAFLKLFEQANTETNNLTKRHLDFYYKDVLKLKEKPSVAGHAHLLVELAKQAETHELKSGELFKAGKDDSNIEAFFANDRDFVANQAKVASLKTVYRHGDEPVVVDDKSKKQVINHKGRIFASPVANSDDGMGAELTTVDHSWHPLFNKIYRDGELVEIKMPQAEIGFAIASHYLLMAEGTRIITLKFTVKGSNNFPGELNSGKANDLICLLSSEKDWIEKGKKTYEIELTANTTTLTLTIHLSGIDAAVTPYNVKTHGYNFATTLPILLVKLKHTDAHQFLYSLLQDVVIEKIELTVAIDGLKTLAVSNDFGPVDTSKPFQPFGASPQKNSALVIGSKEVFQKSLDSAAIKLNWQTTPQPFPDVYEKNPTTGTVTKKIGARKVGINVQYLQAGHWEPKIDAISQPVDITTAPTSFPLSKDKLKASVLDAPDFSGPTVYNTASNYGFVRLLTDNDFGQSDYEQALITYIQQLIDKDTSNNIPKPPPPVAPFITELSLRYTATQTISLSDAENEKSAFDERQEYFFHIAPFGYSEQHPYLKSQFPETETNLPDKAIYLLPPLQHLNPTTDKSLNISKGQAIAHEAEFFIGVSGLKPPQNLALLFQVVDGTVNPRSAKSERHIHWSYLHDNEWINFATSDVQDQTGGLINSGIVTFAIPRDASNNNTLLPTGMHWIRAAVASKSDAVCRLLLVAAQALAATFTDKGNDPAFPAKVLPAGTISTLDQPDADIKQITQPFPSFGGRGEEPTNDFYARVSERLRHKDRAIALWDYERLILEAFPRIYKVKCLNHTRYEINDQGLLIYKELAPGHVTIVTIPNQQFHKQRDPLKPYTSLGLLTEIEAFLRKRLSCFVKPHVINPQFEEVSVDCKVCLRDGRDQTFYENELKKAITRFLSPWAFSDSAHPTFGGKISKAELINFVEELSYVDYVMDFKLFHNGDEKNEVEGSKAISILVSAPRHEIKVINPEKQEVLRETCRCES
jgi:hypothetical protein